MAIGSPQWMYKSGEAYTLDQSLKFDHPSAHSLSRTFASAGNRKTWSFSAWAKRGYLSNQDNHRQAMFGCHAAANDTQTLELGWNSDDTFYITTQSAVTSTSAVFRDTGSWYHILVACDTTQSTATDRFKVYINGVDQAIGNLTSVSQDANTAINQAESHTIGSGYTDRELEGYLAEVHFIDGSTKAPADFGETGTYGEWKPKEYEGSYGTNGFYLPFKNDYSVEGFSTVTWKGSGVANNYIGGAGFKPSLTWLKPRSLADHNLLYDRVRGYQHQIKSNSANAEDITSKVSPATDGILLTTTDQNQNSSSHTYVAWNWDMGADTPTGFGCVTYRGANVADQTVTGYGFSPDLLWIKDRDAANSHHIFDQVRGVNKRIRSDSNAVEDSSNDSQRAFLPDGFRLGAAGTGVTVNGNDYVAWGWDMGGTSVSNTDGSITSTVMANPTYGQSIVKYTSSAGSCTVGHGLSSAPELILYKTLTSNDWVVYHSSIGNAKKLRLNTNDPEGTTADFNSTSPTSSVFTDNVTGGSTDMIAYAFHSVANYSKISSYTGNGSSTGPSVTLGFRPAFVMIKVADRTDGGNGAWWMFDSTRSFGTAIGNVSIANTNGAELVNNSNLAIDFLDNGFQLKSSYDEINVNGGKYVYMAFAGGVDSMSAFNTDGTSESRVKANTTYGQSIVTYKGKSGAQTIGHGLDAAPEFIIVKNRDVTNEWRVYHGSTPGGGNYNAEQYSLRLDSTAAEVDSTYWNDTPPTSSVFTVGDNQVVNSGHGNNYFAYCWHNVTGYSKFNRYSGDGTTDGSNAVNCGFEPAFVMIKCTNDTEAWWIFDNVRNPLNGGEDPKRIAANEQDAEVTGGSTGSDWVEFTSTGFKMTGSGGGVNGNGNTYIYAAFADKREYAYWLDQSGNNNDWTTNNLTESDISVDSPTNNFAILNPLAYRSDSSPSAVTFAEGNLKATLPQTSEAYSNMFTLTGKWYFEILYSDYVYGLTICLTTSPDGTRADWTPSVCYASSGQKRINSSWSSYGDTYTEGDIIGVALNMDDDEVTFYKNGVSQGTLSGGLNSGKAYGLFLSDERGGSVVANFGQDSSFAGNKTAQGKQDSNDIGDFYYTPPTGFLALCTDNLPDVAVVPSEHFNTVVYSGTGSNGNAVTVGFNPSLTWIKSRSGGRDHILVDQVRGNTKLITANTTGAEETGTTDFQSFDSNGFTVGTPSTTGGTNTSGESIISWNWKANGSGSSNSDGDITSTVSANQDAGFSIVKYTATGNTGDTVGHGLGAVPDAIWFKSLTTQSWNCFFPNTSMGATKGLQLDNTGGQNTVAYMNNTMPTASVFSLGANQAATNAYADGVGQDYIVYCWKNIAGYSRVGTYTGNGSTDGTFVWTGFRPSYVQWKKIDYGGNIWQTFGYVGQAGSSQIINPLDRYVSSSSGGAEGDYDFIDFVSNGFKLRHDSGHANGSGETYIYIAFAETPFKYSNGR